MAEIINEKLLACHINMTKLLRCISIQHNAIAGINFYVSPVDAMKHYICVLNLRDKYQNYQLKMDRHQV